MSGQSNPEARQNPEVRKVVAQIRALERDVRATSGGRAALGSDREQAAAGDRAGAGPIGSRLDAEGMAHLEVLLRASQGTLSPRWAARVAALRRAHALRGRTVPDGALDGLVQAVQAQVLGTGEGRGSDSAQVSSTQVSSTQAWARAGLSASFLDAPRRLAIWRRSAVAAIALLGVGVGAWATGVLHVAPAGPSADRLSQRYDPRDDLLERDRPMEWGARSRHQSVHPHAERRFGGSSKFGRARAPGQKNRPGPLHLMGTRDMHMPAPRSNRTVVFPLRDLSDANVSDMLDGLSIPDIGSGLVEHN